MADLKFLGDDWPALDRLLDTALSQAPAEREAWLEGLTEPEAVKAKLRFLLGGAAGIETADFLNDLPRMTLGGLATPPHDLNAEAKAGGVIGPYRLIRELGVGGMGVVWLAERHDGGLKRPVALKLPRVSWTRGLAERMHRERDILARLDHPNIAQIFDAGLDDSGRPYLALEYVEGEAIDVYCKRLTLTVPQRLQLILQVARAVAHAHARLVVHRDLKPANILVTQAGSVQLLDFGIAKLLEGESTVETELTMLGGHALTLDYASPEQVRGEPLGAASDVYSFGVVAYELLTGAKPYHLKRQSAAALEEAITSMDVRRASAAAADPGTRRALKGDLDAILHKALEKGVDARYPTVDAFAQDIERHLAHLPVSARRDSLVYRLRKTLRRNPLLVAVATLASVVVLAQLSVALWQTHEARAQARRAVAVQSFMKQVFSANGPEQAQGEDIGARELLQRGAARLATDFKDQPEVQADLEHEIADILNERGENPEAQAHYERAIALYEQLGQGDTDPAAEARLSLSDVLYNEGQYPAALALAQHCVDQAAQRFGAPPPWLLRARAGAAVLAARLGHSASAVAQIEQALAEHQRAGFAPGADTANAWSALGHAQMSVEAYRQAGIAYTRAIAEWRLLPGTAITGLLIERLNLQNARVFAGDTGPVVQEMPELVAAFDKYIGPQAPNTLDARLIWAKALVATGRYDEGLKVQRDNLAHAQAAGASGEEGLPAHERGLVYLLRSSARYADALQRAQPLLARMDAGQPDPSWAAEILRGATGELQRATGDPTAALRTLTQALTRSRQLPGQEARRADLLVGLALSEHDLGLAAAARRDMAEALAIYRRGFDPDNMSALRCAALAAWLDAIDRPGDAAPAAAFERAASAYAATQPARHLSHAEIGLLRAEWLERAGQPQRARAEREAAVQAWNLATGLVWQPPVAMLH